jgi:hypothetical protein
MGTGASMHGALALAPGSASAAIGDGNFTGQLETGSKTIVHIVNGDVFGLFVEILVHHHGETVDLANIITFLGFVQNHRKGWSASAAGLQKNPDGADFLPLEVFHQDLFSCIGNIDHKLDNSFQHLFCISSTVPVHNKVTQPGQACKAGGIENVYA